MKRLRSDLHQCILFKNTFIITKFNLSTFKLCFIDFLNFNFPYVVFKNNFENCPLKNQIKGPTQNDMLKPLLYFKRFMSIEVTTLKHLKLFKTLKLQATIFFLINIFNKSLQCSILLAFWLDISNVLIE